MCASVNSWSAARWSSRFRRAAVAVLPCLAAAALAAGCADIIEPASPAVPDGEWDYVLALPGSEGGWCTERGALRLGAAAGGPAGVIRSFESNCTAAAADTLADLRVTADSIRFSARGCAYAGGLVGGPDSIAGVLECPGWGGGPWSAARVGAPSRLDISPGGRTLAVGGTQEYRAVLRDPAGRPLYARLVTWSVDVTGIVVLADEPPASMIVVAGAPGTAVVTGTSQGISASVTIVVAGAAFAKVGVGSLHSCGVSPAGIGWCWGNNTDGMLGTGDTVSTTSPAPVAGGHIFTTITGGRWHTCALDTAGAAWCWGYNGGGWLGDGTLTERHEPVAVAGGHTFTALVAGDYHTCALTAAGEAWCWGGNGVGQLGDSSHIDRSTPVRVTGGKTFVELTAGQALTCGRTATGAAWCWGTNGWGQQGTGSTDSTGTPYPSAVAGGHLFIAITIGRLHACGVDFSGAAWCWGSGTYGQTGLGSRTLVRVPTAVTGGIAFASITAKSDHTCGLTGAGVLWCWGSNGLGQLGVASPTESDVPVAVSGNHLFGSMAAGEVHTCALDDNAVLWCWGGNWYGQVGDGTRTDRSAPVRVLGQL